MNVPSISKVTILSSTGIKLLDFSFVTSATYSQSEESDSHSFHNLKWLIDAFEQPPSKNDGITNIINDFFINFLLKL